MKTSESKTNRFDASNLAQHVEKAQYSIHKFSLENVEDAIARYGTIRMDQDMIVHKLTYAELDVDGKKYFLSTNPTYAVIQPRDHWREDFFQFMKTSFNTVTHLTPSELSQDGFLENTYLEVPYAMKNEAKALGARWDNEEKLWYAPEGSDRKAFEKFMSQDQSEPKFLDAKGFFKSPNILGRVELYEVVDGGTKSYHLLGGDVEQGTFNATWYFDHTFSERAEAEAKYKRLMPSFDEKDYAIQSEILKMVAQVPNAGSVKEALDSLEGINKTQTPQLK